MDSITADSQPSPPQRNQKQTRGPTQQDLSFYSIDPEGIQKKIQRAVTNGTLTQADADLLIQFLLEEGVRRSWSLSRKIKLASTLITARCFFIQSFQDSTINDLYLTLDKIRASKSRKGRKYKDNTVRDYFIAIKQFYSWLIENKLINMNLGQVSRIKTPSRDRKTKTTDNILLPHETQALLSGCRNSSDIALLAIWYEAALRPGEVAKMVWKDLIFHQGHVTLHVISKTCYPRIINLFYSHAALLRWRDDYPFKYDPDSLVFVNARGQPFTYAAIAKKVERLKANAGINKNITPHCIRHTRITDLARDKTVPESYIRKIMWGNEHSQELATYTHLSDDDNLRFAAEALGISLSDTAGPQDKAVKMVSCRLCGTYYPAYLRVCKNCGHPLDAVEILDTSSIMRIIDGISLEGNNELSKLIGTPQYNQILQELTS